MQHKKQKPKKPQGKKIKTIGVPQEKVISSGPSNRQIVRIFDTEKGKKHSVTVHQKLINGKWV